MNADVKHIREIAQYGRPIADTDRAASVIASGLARRGLVERTGLCWSRIDSTKQVAEYQPTDAGRDLTGATQAKRDAYEQFENDLRNGCLRTPGNLDEVVFEPEKDSDGEWSW